MLATVQGARLSARRLAASAAARSYSNTSGHVVNSHNEWDTLEEVIVGSVKGAVVPEWSDYVKAVAPPKWETFFKENAGKPFPEDMMIKAEEELQYFCDVLEGEGVKTRRPDVFEGDYHTGFSTPDFTSNHQLYCAMPRDVLIVVGNEIIVAPMGWRERWMEHRPYRSLLKEYFHGGAKWTEAPKPQMGDEFYEENYVKAPGKYITTEFEPCFDAAEFCRMGRDLFCQRSQVSNYFGLEWMQRNLGDEYRVHVLDFQDQDAMHIDTTMVPLGPRKIMYNPKRPCVTGETLFEFEWEGETREYKLPEMFHGKGFEWVQAPTPSQQAQDLRHYFTSGYTATANILLIGPDKVVCEAHEEETIRVFESEGFKVFPVPFQHFLPFGGSFHCATTDVRRASKLEDYFN